MGKFVIKVIVASGICAGFLVAIKGMISNVAIESHPWLNGTVYKVKPASDYK